MLWGFIRRYAPGTTPETHPELDRLVDYAIAYFNDFVQPAKRYRPPTEQEREAFADLHARLGAVAAGTSGEDIQAIVYEVGKGHGFEPLRAWFQGLYEVLLGQSQGPRFGSFVELYGIEETRAMMGRVIGAHGDEQGPTAKGKAAVQA